MENSPKEYIPLVTLQTSDKKEIVIKLETACQIGTLKVMLDDCNLLYTDGVIPLPKVNSTTMEIILKWLDLYDPIKDIPQYGNLAPALKARTLRQYQYDVWKKVFGEKFASETLVAVISATDYLNIPDLRQYAIFCMSNIIKQRSLREMRADLGQTASNILLGRPYDDEDSDKDSDDDDEDEDEDKYDTTSDDDSTPSSQAVITAKQNDAKTEATDIAKTSLETTTDATTQNIVENKAENSVKAEGPNDEKDSQDGEDEYVELHSDCSYPMEFIGDNVDDKF